MNCLEDGHTSHHCKAAMMCPYCAEYHTADKCDLRGKTTSSCTACACEILKKTPDTDLQALFSTTPVHLRHSLLDPTCPTRLAAKKLDAAKAANAANTAPKSAPLPSNRALGSVSKTTTPPAIIEIYPPATKVGANSEDTQMAVSQ